MMQNKALKTGDIKSLEHLRHLAMLCFYVQLGISFVYFISSLVYPESNQLAVFCGILAIAASLTPLVYCVIHKQFNVIFSCVTLFNLAPIWFLYLEAVIPGYDAYEYIKPLYRMQAFFWISVFLLVTNLLYVLLWKNGSRYSIKSFKFLGEIKINPKMYAWFTILAFVVPLISFYYFYGSGDKLWTYLTAGRSEKGTQLMMENTGSFGALMSPLTWLLQLTPLFGAIAFVSAKSKAGFYPVISFILTLVVIFIFFLSGSRGTMMFVAAPALFFLFYYNWQKGLKFWIPATMLLFVLIGIMEFQVRFRGDLLGVMANPEKAAKEADLQSATTFDPSKSHRDNNTYLLCLLIKGYPDKYDYEGFSGLLAVLANPIPRVIWPNKPVMAGAKDLDAQPGFILDGPLFMGTTSLSYSIVGDAYKTYGLLGIIVYGILYAFFLIFFDGIIYYTKYKHALAAGMLGVGVFLAFWGFRSMFALITFLYPIMLLLIGIHFIQMLRRI